MTMNEATTIHPQFMTRQFAKRQRAGIAHENMLARYNLECGTVLCRKATPQEIERYDRIIEQSLRKEGSYRSRLF